MTKIRTSLSDEDNGAIQSQIASSCLAEHDLANADSEISALAGYSGFEDLAEFYAMQLKWINDSIRMDSVWANKTDMHQINEWSDQDGSSAQMHAKVILEFNDEFWRPIPDMVEPFEITEIDVRPSDAFNKTNVKEQVIKETSDKVEAQDLTAYPNPFNNSITFATNGQAGELFIFDIRGVLVSKINVPEKTTRVDFDGSILTSGIYIASFKTQLGQSETIRIVKH